MNCSICADSRTVRKHLLFVAIVASALAGAYFIVSNFVRVPHTKSIVIRLDAKPYRDIAVTPAKIGSTVRDLPVTLVCGDWSMGLHASQVSIEGINNDIQRITLYTSNMSRDAVATFANDIAGIWDNEHTKPIELENWIRSGSIGSFLLMDRTLGNDYTHVTVHCVDSGLGVQEWSWVIAVAWGKENW